MEEQKPNERTQALSPFGKTLLKQLKATPNALSPAAVLRWGIDRPDSIFHALPESMRTMMGNLPEELNEKNDTELEQMFGGVSRQDRRVRILLWEKFEQASKEAKEMKLEDVAKEAGLPAWASFEQKLYMQPALLAWLMKPPAHYQLQMKEAQELGLDRLIEIMSLPIKYVDDKGKERINTSVALVVLSAFKLVDNRLFGAPTQKNVNVNVDTGKAPEGATLDMAAVDKRLKELAQELGEQLPGILDKSDPGEKPPIVDVESTSE